MKKATHNNYLAVTHPEVAELWHPTKNGDLSPYDFTYGSRRKIWWKCSKGHEWTAKIADRTRGSGCPYCSGKKASKENNLAVLQSTLAKQWHPQKNSDLTPKDVTPGSSKKAWWICENGHEWEAQIAKRTGGQNCPYCSGRRVGADNNLAVLLPDLAKGWHPRKNDPLTPNDVTVSSSKKVWWMCEQKHEWIATIANRTRGSGCPYCAGRLASRDNNLSVVLPDLAKEWHPEKNGDLSPNNVTIGSHKKVWWICKKGHEWKAQIKSRSSGRGCPYCQSQTSKFEIRVYSELKKIFGNVKWREKIFDFECDIYLPDYQIGIEIDGVYWHKNKADKDKEKNEKLEANSIHLFRLRERGLSKISSNDIFFTEKDKDYELKTIKRLLKLLSKYTTSSINKKIQTYIKKSVFQNEATYKKILSWLPAPPSDNSLSELYPKIASEWNHYKNFPLTPELFTPHSHEKVWWVCEKKHEWKAVIASRTDGRGCPYCSGKKASKENNLAIVNPDLAKQWHPRKNGYLTPFDVVQGSHKKVWWICENDHEWKAQIKSRTSGRGCPYCSGYIVGNENNLATLYPAIANQWNSPRNGDLTPQDVHGVSGLKVWWICEEKHEWKARIASRVYGNNCPYCSGKRASKDNNLTIHHPDLAKQWHPEKNGDLTPYDVTTGSQKKVWWVCEKGHEWIAVIGSRSDGRGCPYCSGRLICNDNCLQTINPNLAMEWHPNRNGNLSPRDVTTKSGKKVWWKCRKGHEWPASIANRSNGSGCPHCSRKK